VHADLKCNNILIGDDGLAKLTDFGLSVLKTTAPSDEPEAEADNPAVGAVRWKAPEVLRGERATLASDVYSFAMCILEAVSGKYPWGMLIPDAAVAVHVVKRKAIPSRPERCSGRLPARGANVPLRPE
jgi:serine/threonine protein kinase